MITQDKTKRQTTTLNPNYKCDTCGEPAMVVEADRFYSCPKCWLEKQGRKIKGLDHTGYYP
jgi:ribosomal protein L37AE/L43A